MTQLQAVPVDFEALHRLDRDLKAASRLMKRQEARYLCDLFYQVQEFRKASANQQRQIGEVEPHAVLAWVFANTNTLEKNINSALGEFAREYAVGRWMQTICGVGNVISAGFLAYLDIRLARTCGHFFNFMGLNPEQEWLGKEGARALVKEALGDGSKVTEAVFQGVAALAKRHPENLRRLAADVEGKVTRAALEAVLAKRPWCAAMKRLAWVVGDCFVKFQNHEDDFYGRFYVERKAREEELNERKAFADQAAASLAKKNYGKDTEARKWYEQGKLPPARIHLRALRWASKLFISHLHTVMFWDYYGVAPPVPYAFEKCPGDHRHYIPPPHHPWIGGGKSLRVLLDGAASND